MPSEKSNIEQAFEILRRLELIQTSAKEKQELAFVRSIFITLLRQDQQSFLPSYLMDDFPSTGTPAQSGGSAAPPAVVKNWLRTNFSQAQSDSEHTVIVRQAVSAFKGLLHKGEPKEVFDLSSLPAATQQVLEGRDSWDFDVFALTHSVGGDMKLAALAVMHKIFEDWDFFGKLQIKRSRLKLFVETVIDHYNDNPYHCSIHILDVTQTLHAMLKAGLAGWLNDLQRLGLIVAGFIHDVEHDGLSNIYHVKTFSSRALAHNDVSPQENHHLVTSFSLMKRRGLGIFNDLDPLSFSIVRGVIVRSVLYSDMSQHFKLLENFKTLTDEKGLSAGAYENKDVELVCSLALHAADISNPAKSFDLARTWTQRVMTEFFRQGDLERERGLPISPMCDRLQPAVPDSQCGFIKYVVKPTFVFLQKLIPDLVSPLDHLERNFGLWEGLRSKTIAELEEMNVMPVNHQKMADELREKLKKEAEQKALEEGAPGSSASSS
jgi:hypothetical protein